MKTVEERAEDVMSVFRCMLIETIDGRVLTGIDLMNMIAEGMRELVEDCAKFTDDESIRLDALGMGYKQRGDLVTATRYSACIVTAAKLGREIRALAAPTEQTEGKGIER